MRYVKTVKELCLRVRRLPMTREEQVYYNYAIQTPRQANEAALSVSRTFLVDLDQEHFISIPLDARAKPLGVHLAAVGGPDQCEVDIRSVFRISVLVNATSLVVAHNHPSGDPTPSFRDLDLTARIARSAEILGITLFDHLIVTHADSYTSIRASHEGLFKPPYSLD